VARLRGKSPLPEGSANGARPEAGATGAAGVGAGTPEAAAVAAVAA
jgi:hypothetical protein